MPEPTSTTAVAAATAGEKGASEHEKAQRAFEEHW